MLFSSLTFLFLFLPAVFLLYRVLPASARNAFLLTASLVFYAWGSVSHLLLLLISIGVNYGFGLGIGQGNTPAKRKRFLVAGLVFNLLLLGTLKYAGFFAENLNTLLALVGIPEVGPPKIKLPIGISFFTFQALSYLVDVYRGETPVQKRLHDLALYIALFPQLIAGPIVRYKDVAEQLAHRTADWKLLSSGIERFILGLAKKVLLANQFGAVADLAFGLAPEELSAPFAWVGVVAYSFQIYFDFAGYSDMAIGLGRMFGFRFLENFNFPYLATSIQDFWRRWHISLSSWFRDYLYIPLGGNRKGASRTYFNLVVVFFLTGFWHGSSWNFVLWGLFHGFFLILERWGLSKVLNRLWKPLTNIYVFAIASMAWVLFRADDFAHAWGYYQALFSGRSIAQNIQYTQTFLNNEFLLVTTIGLLGAFGFFPWVFRWGKKLLGQPNGQPFQATRHLYHGFTILFLMGFLYLSSLYLVSQSYNPFIYFRF